MVYRDTCNIVRVIEAMLPHVGFLTVPEVKPLDSDEHEPQYPHARPGASFDVGGFVIDVLDVPAQPGDLARGIPPLPANVAFHVTTVEATPSDTYEPPAFHVVEIGTFRTLYQLFNALNQRMLSAIEMNMATALEYEQADRFAVPQPR